MPPQSRHMPHRSPPKPPPPADLQYLRPSEFPAADTMSEHTAAVRNYHFVGIGGCGMSGLALVLAQRGHNITGSDMNTSPAVETLGSHGIDVAIGHSVDNLPQGIDCLVVSAAIRQDNPEWCWARQHGVAVRKYSELLGELSVQIPTLAVAGTHGKSTTSGWLAYVLQQAGLNPSFVIGADVGQLGGASGVGTGPQLVVEACEYDRSFLNLRPHAAAILNIEGDHFDYYRDVDEIISVFCEFACLVDPAGLLVANADDPNIGPILEAIAQLEPAACPHCELFGLAAVDADRNTSDSRGTITSSTQTVAAPNTNQPDWWPAKLRLDDGRGRFELMHRGRCLGSVELTLAGMHNVANAMAVAALAHHAGAADGDICRALSTFAGVGRRMSNKGHVAGILILDDYAHHPTEIRVTLEAIRQRYRPRRLWCVFQPHQHSRTRFLLDDFALSFGAADVVLLPDIYFVRDSDAVRREINAQQLSREIVNNSGQALYLRDFDTIATHLCRELLQGDLVVTMGAGDIWKLGDELIHRLGRDR